MEEENKKIKPQRDKDCNCDSRQRDEIIKKQIQKEIERTYEEIIQLEQALIELDEQNTLNAMEIRKRDAKVFLFGQQCQDNEEELSDKENTQDHQKIKQNQLLLTKQISQQRDQIVILHESTKQNLQKRQTMKQQLYQNYQQIRQIRDSIASRIQNLEIRDYLELVIKNNFLESQNV
jgi:hypothetical protein